MNVLLYGYGGNRSIATNAWLNLVDLAREFGWEPDRREFESSSVISSDAQQLADTLANAIAENQTGTATDETETFKGQLLKFFSNQGERAMLNDLIPFFRTGAFRFRDQKSQR